MADVKLACAAWGFRKMQLPEYFDAVREMDIELVEVNLGPNSPGHLPFDATDADLDRAAQAAKDAGVEIVALAGGNNFAAEDLDAEIAKVNSQIDMCVALGADVLRIFAGWLKPATYTDADFDRISDALFQVGEYALERGVVVAMENHGGITATGAQCYRLLIDPICELLEGADRQSLGLNYDPANFRHAGEDPLGALMVTGDLIVYSHWKDVRFEGETPEYCAVGEGMIEWAPVIEEMIATGFDGYWAIEYEEAEDVVRGTRDSAAYLRKVLAELG
jgi:sugar phosphate isomerase/epimerase